MSESVYCVVCQRLHAPPVAIAINDVCPLELMQDVKRAAYDAKVREMSERGDTRAS